MALGPVRISTSCSAYHPAGLTYQPSSSSSERRYVFDSGGRPNGTPGSGLMITMGPRKSPSRNATAALPPVRPLPTITIGAASACCDVIPGYHPLAVFAEICDKLVLGLIISHRRGGCCSAPRPSSPRPELTHGRYGSRPLGSADRIHPRELLGEISVTSHDHAASPLGSSKWLAAEGNRSQRRHIGFERGRRLRGPRAGDLDRTGRDHDL